MTAYFAGLAAGILFSVIFDKLAKVADGGKNVYREKLLMSMKLQSFNQKAEIKIEQTYEFDSKPPFRLLKCDYSHAETGQDPHRQVNERS